MQYLHSAALYLNFPLGVALRMGLMVIMNPQKWWVGFGRLCGVMERARVLVLPFTNWNMPFNLSELQFCHVNGKLFQRISVMIKWDSDGTQ